MTSRRHSGWLAALGAAAVLVGGAHAAPLASGSVFAVLPPRAAAATYPPEVADAVVRARHDIARAPGPLPELHTEGTLPGRGIRDISIAAKRDHQIALDFAIAWRATGDRAFLAQSERYLVGWAKVYRMSFNPIDETGFDALLVASDLTWDGLTPGARDLLAKFWRRMAVGYLDAMDGTPKNAGTNWQSHRVKLATLAAYRTGDRRLIDRARAAYERQVVVNLRPDGSTYDFEERDALHYVTYNLDPLLTAAIAARAHGDDWFGFVAAGGASLPRSVAWLASFARGERTHMEFANSRIAFDRERAAAGQSDFAPHLWQPTNALNTFSLAATLDPRLSGLRDELAAKAGRRPPAWIAFLKS